MQRGANGVDSSFLTTTTSGGGAAGSHAPGPGPGSSPISNRAGVPGGSGGGGGMSTGGPSAKGTGVACQGNPGGDGYDSASPGESAGGGGGDTASQELMVHVGQPTGAGGAGGSRC